MMVAVSVILSLLYFRCLRERCLREFVNPTVLGDCWPLRQGEAGSYHKIGYRSGAQSRSARAQAAQARAGIGQSEAELATRGPIRG